MFEKHSFETWVVFHLIVLALLALDLGIFNRKAHVIRLKEALGWSVVWILIGLGFGYYISWHDGAQAGAEYLAGYIVEKSLSVDNLFVFAIIFSAFKIERGLQHRLLFWGILGAIILRAGMIYAGAELLNRFHWVIYIFGAFLIFTGIKLFLAGDKAPLDPHKSPFLKLARKFLPFTDAPHHGRFVLVEDGKKKFTLFFAALLLIESSDVIFALDSVPAVFGVTRDPFIVYTSNIFAILGLRSLFFVLEDMLYRFHLLKVGLSLVLVFVGSKMIAEPFFHMSPWTSLGIISAILITSIVLSWCFPPKKI